MDYREKWIQGFKGKYAVSNIGTVLSFVKPGQYARGTYELPRTLKPWVNNRGYPLVQIASKAFLVSRLVATAFIKNTKNYPCVNHKDNNPLNNYVENLEWCSHLENIQYASRQNRMHSGEKQYNHKLTDKKVKMIRQLYKRVKGRDLAKRFHVSPQTICNIGKGVTWKHITA